MEEMGTVTVGPGVVGLYSLWRLLFRTSPQRRLPVSQKDLTGWLQRSFRFLWHSLTHLYQQPLLPCCWCCS